MFITEFSLCDHEKYAQTYTCPCSVGILEIFVHFHAFRRCTGNYGVRATTFQTIAIYVDPCSITETSHPIHGVSNHRQLGSVLYKIKTKKTSKVSYILTFVMWIYQWQMGCFYKGPVMRKAFSWLDIIVPSIINYAHGWQMNKSMVMFLF